LSSSEITAGVLSLAGVAIGAAGSFGVQWFTSRTTAAQARAKRLADLREERKAAILQFLDTAQVVERLAERRYAHEQLVDPESSTHLMWFLQKALELVATETLRHAARDYAWRLNEAVYKELPVDKDIWAFLAEQREPIMSAARVELDVPTFEGGRPGEL
jgi:hypothetical protein